MWLTEKRNILLTLLLIFICSHSFSQWQVITSNTTKTLVEGCFTNDSTGFIVSADGSIFKTEDWGSSWQLKATLTGVFTSIYNVGADTIYAGGNCLYRSMDGGNTWAPLTTFSYTITDMGFFNSDRGYIIVPGYTYCTWADGPHTYDNFSVHETTDGGLTWLYKFGGANHYSRFQFINDSTAFITGGVVSIIVHCAGPWNNTSKRTDNKGVSWVSVLQANAPFALTSYFSFIDENIGYLLQPNSNNNIYKTIDGGTTLSQSYTEIYDNTIRQCHFINEIDGYILGKNNIYVTASNGFCFTNEYTSSETLINIFECSAGFLFCVGTNGLILKKGVVPSAYPDTIYRIILDNSSLDFGYVNVDSSFTKQLTVTNSGSNTLDLSVKSDNAYKICFDNNLFTDSLNVSLIPFQDTVLYIKFTPTAEQVYNDTLYFEADSLTPVKVPLSGEGFLGLNGNITSDTLLCAPVINIGGDVTIPDSVKVVICAGTTVKFLGNFKITVLGQLRALGDSAQNINFVAADTIVLWNGISIDQTNSNDSSIFNYCNIIDKCNSPSIYASKGNIMIDHCNIRNEIGSRAVYINGQVNMILKNSNIFKTNGNAVQCSNFISTSILNNNIYENRKGIVFSSSIELNIDSNSIYNNSQQGIYGFGNVKIKNNRIHNNGGGVFFEGFASTIENNLIYNNKSGGIYCTAGNQGCNIIQNVIFNNESYANGGGLEIAPYNNNSLPVNVINNIICNNKAGSGGRGNNFYATSNSGGGLEIKLFNNIFYDVSNSNNSIAWFYDVVHQINYNCINQDSINIWGQNNIDYNPSFVNPTDSIGFMNNIGTYDWSLYMNSHCINTGDSLNISLLLPFDFVGNPRIYNYRVDMGAYEYQGNYNNITETSNDILIFPNPTKGVFRIVTNNNSKGSIKIYNSLGVIVYQTENINPIIDLSGQSQGVYFIQIQLSEKTQVKKIMLL